MKDVAFGVAGLDWQERIDFPRMRKERLSRTQAAMRKSNLAAALLTRGENIRYVTGVRGAEFIPGLRYALAFAEHDPIIYELGDTLSHHKLDCSWVKPENWRVSYCWLNGTPGPEATRAEAKKWADAIVRDLKEKGLSQEKLGVDVLDEAARNALRDAGIETVSVSPVMTEVVRTKTAEEIKCIRLAIAIANVGFWRVCEVLKPGVKEGEVGAEVQAAMARAGAEFSHAGFKSGPNAFDVYHLAGMDRLVQFGDLSYVNLCSTSYMGYRVCYYRTFIVGRRPNQKEKDWYRKAYERLYSILGEIKPGATTADAAKHFLPASTWGYAQESATLVAEVGHGIGLGMYQQPIISRLWSLDYPQTFEPGMVIAVEDREGEMGYGGVRLEEMAVVTEKGHEVLTTWPAEEITTVRDMSA